MKRRKEDLEKTLKSTPKAEFPGMRSYTSRYTQIAEFLEREVHPYVQMGALLEDGIFLNDHGAEHVRTVIERASQLVSAQDFDLTGYEVYLLLAAIQLHDIGNLLGRLAHEKKPAEIRGRLQDELGDNALEKKMIFDIAAAHGGDIGGDKDTIRHLPTTARLLNFVVEPQKLAAILRFADELADDRRRASRFVISQGRIPDRSRLYHKYSETLQSVIVDTTGKEVHLDFELTSADACCRFVKNGTDVYLLDEIFARTLKMHFERMYCMRFLMPKLIDRINVKVSVFTGRSFKPLEVGWRLEERGYPQNSSTTVHDLDESLTSWKGVGLNAATLEAAVRQKEAEEASNGQGR